MAGIDRVRRRHDGGVRARILAAAAALALGTLSAAASAQATPADVGAAIRSAGAPKEIRGFYAARLDQPLWIRAGAVGPEADLLLGIIATAALDGLDPDDYRPRAIAAAIRKADDGTPKALAKAEMMLSRSFAALARDMRRPRDVGVVYADAGLAPRVPTARELLQEAGGAASLSGHLQRIGWMHPLYGQLRQAAAAQLGTAAKEGAAAELNAVRLNLDRARALPASPGRRYVLVDAAAARLWMYDNGKVAGTMRVVVGKPSEPTPMMVALIRYASVNPYWNVPADLVRVRVAPGAIDKGTAFLKAKRFEVLSDWSDQARVVDPKAVDWQAIQDGRSEARVRQRPGPGNAMGRIKFMFPNALGVYLHDTPDKALLRETGRMFSAGCVRVEDAPRLARWLFGKLPAPKSKAPEQRVDLPRPVPVYITYMTAAADKGALVFRPDVYGRDVAPAKAGSPRRYASR